MWLPSLQTYLALCLLLTFRSESTSGMRQKRYSPRDGRWLLGAESDGHGKDGAGESEAFAALSLVTLNITSHGDISHWPPLLLGHFWGIEGRT